LVRKVIALAGLALFAASGMTDPAAAASRHHFFKKKNKTDFALFDATNAANLAPGGVCQTRFQGSKPWNFHVAVTNNDPTNTQSFKVIYKDGDWVQYYVAPHTSFALTQSAGNNPAGVAIRVFAAQSSQLTGAVSGQGLDGTTVTCKSCDNDSDGPAACDAIIKTP
jgi:hypothetical protein